MLRPQFFPSLVNPILECFDLFLSDIVKPALAPDVFFHWPALRRTIGHFMFAMIHFIENPKSCFDS